MPLLIPFDEKVLGTPSWSVWSVFVLYADSQHIIFGDHLHHLTLVLNIKNDHTLLLKQRKSR